MLTATDGRIRRRKDDAAASGSDGGGGGGGNQTESWLVRAQFGQK